MSRGQGARREPGVRQKAAAAESRPLASAINTARPVAGRAGRLCTLMNTMYMPRGGAGLPTNCPSPWSCACQPPTAEVPCRLGDLASPGAGPPSPTAALPVRALCRPGSARRSRPLLPSIPCHLYPEPQLRHHFLLNVFLMSEGRRRRGASTLACISWAAAGVGQ